jgi:hypothetical protein
MLQSILTPGQWRERKGAPPGVPHCYHQRRQPAETKTQELLGAQVESHRDEQESKREGEGTPRGIRLRVITLEGP